MCQEAILSWFRSILNISFGTTFFDLADGIIISRLLNQFQPQRYKINEEEYQETNFVMNYARITQIVKLMESQEIILEKVIPLKIVEATDEGELIKFVYNTIKIIIDWRKAKEELMKLRRDQIQYIYDFVNQEEIVSQQYQLLKKINEFESLNNQFEIQIQKQTITITQLERQNQLMQDEKQQQAQEIQNLKLQLFQQQLGGIGTEQNEALNFLKKENLHYQQQVSQLKAELTIKQSALKKIEEDYKNYQELQKEIEVQKRYYNKDIIDDLQQRNLILKEQVKNLDDCSRAQKENSFQQPIEKQRCQTTCFDESFQEYNKQDQQQNRNYQLEIQQLKTTIKDLESQNASQQYKNNLIEKFQSTPKPPRPKQNYMSDQKPRNTHIMNEIKGTIRQQFDENLSKQNILLRKIITMLEIQGCKNTVPIIHYRGKSLNC